MAINATEKKSLVELGKYFMNLLVNSPRFFLEGATQAN